VVTDVERVDSPFRQPADQSDIGPAAAAIPAASPDTEFDARSQAGVDIGTDVMMTDHRPLLLDLAVREMTGYEEEVVERKCRAPNTAALSNEILARCMGAPGADFTRSLARIRRLLVVERDVALVRLRQQSLGNEVEMIVDCPSCGAENEASFPLDSLPLPVADVPARVSLTLADGTGVEMRLPTAGDQEDLLNAGISSSSERRTWLLARCLIRLGDRERPRDGHFDDEIARGLTIADRRALEAALERALPEFDLQMATICHKCRHEFVTPFDVSAFFFAELRQRARRLLVEVHRLARTYHWPESEILRLPITRRLDYLMLIEAEDDAQFLSQFEE